MQRKWLNQSWEWKMVSCSDSAYVRFLFVSCSCDTMLDMTVCIWRYQLLPVSTSRLFFFRDSLWRLFLRTRVVAALCSPPPEKKEILRLEGGEGIQKKKGSSMRLPATNSLKDFHLCSPSPSLLGTFYSYLRHLNL